MKILLVLALVFLFPAVAFADEPAFHYGAFMEGTPIVQGTIGKIAPGAGDSNATLTLEVEKKLRGDAGADELVFPFSTQTPNAKYPLMLWSRVTPEVGKKVIVFLTGEAGKWDAADVMDAEGDDAASKPLLQDMLALEQKANAGDKAAPFSVLSHNGPRFLVNLAADELLNKLCAKDDPCRAETLGYLSQMARKAANSSSDRVWAVHMIGTGVYTGFTANDEADAKAFAVLLDLLRSPDINVRREDVQITHGLLLGGGKTVPQVVLEAAARAKITAQLAADLKAHTDFAEQAGELVPLMMGHKP